MVGMEFLTVQQADAQPFRTEYKYSIAAGWVSFLVLGAATVGFAFLFYRAWAGPTTVGIIISAWLTLWFGLFTLMFRGRLRARLRKTNWLVRSQPSGILIKFRSYLNFHFDDADAIVVYIDYGDIEF